MSQEIIDNLKAQIDNQNDLIRNLESQIDQYKGMAQTYEKIIQAQAETITAYKFISKV